MTPLLNYLRDSEEYNEVEGINLPVESNEREFQNIIDEESNTVLTVISTEIEEDTHTFSATLRFEIENQPYWVESFVENEKELNQFRRDAEDIMTNMINRYQDF